MSKEDNNVVIHSKVWRGRYRNIHFEICTHMVDSNGGPWWNTYIILNNKYNPNYIKYLWVHDYKEFTRFNGKVVKYQDPKDDWNYLSWNGGQTLYEQQSNDDWDEFKSIKIGDDYQHSWDYERSRNHLDEDFLQIRCERMIDELISLMNEKGIIEENCIE